MANFAATVEKRKSKLEEHIWKEANERNPAWQPLLSKYHFISLLFTPIHTEMDILIPPSAYVGSVIALSTLGIWLVQLECIYLTHLTSFKSSDLIWANVGFSMADTVREVWSMYKAYLRLFGFFAFYRTKQIMMKNDKLRWTFHK